MSEEMYACLCKEIDDMFEKWALFYDAALASPDAFKKLDSEYGNVKSFPRLKEHPRLADSDTLDYKYFEAQKFIMCVSDLYSKDYASPMETLAVFIDIFIDERIEEKKHLKEINEEWNPSFFNPNKGNSNELGELPAKRVKKDEQAKKVTFGSSVACNP